MENYKYLLKVSPVLYDKYYDQHKNLEILAKEVGEALIVESQTIKEESVRNQLVDHANEIKQLKTEEAFVEKVDLLLHWAIDNELMIKIHTL